MPDDHSDVLVLLVNLLNWRLSVKRLMRSLKIIVVNKHCKPLADAQPTAHP